MTKLKSTRYPGVHQISPQLFRLRGKILDPRTGETKEVKKVVEAESAKVAAAMRTQALNDAISETNTSRVKVGDFAKSWIESKAAVVSKYTLEGYAYALEKHVLPVLGRFYYDTVGHLEVQSMVNNWLTSKKADGAQRYSTRSVKDWFWVFRNMTRDAIAQLGLTRDPTLRITFGENSVAKQGEEGDETAKLTIGESEQLLGAMQRRRPGSFALLSTKRLTGQRFCHVSALKIGDIDLAQMIIRFKRKQVRGVVGPISKKKPVPKVIPILPELASVLETHILRLGKLGYPVDNDAWLFPSRKGGLKQPSSLVTAMKSSLKDAGLTKRITPHMMRYLFNDVLRQAGVDKVTRKALTGHVTDEMTEHYSHVQLEEKRAAMAAAGMKLRDEKVDLLVDSTAKNEKAA